MNPETFTKIARRWSSFIKNVHFDCRDYRGILNEVERDDFVYLDPPYAGNKDRFIIEKIDRNEFFSFIKKSNLKKINKKVSTVVVQYAQWTKRHPSFSPLSW